jgi:hypothetical protein
MNWVRAERLPSRGEPRGVATSGDHSGRAATRRQDLPPILTLLFSSAVIVEVLFGSTHLTIITALIPEIGFYGGAALIIRYVARREGLGWLSILTLGVAFAVFEEFLVVQTSVSPYIFSGLANATYGRALGVNWIYFLWATGYESVWAIVLPIYLTEVVFPTQRRGPWLGRRGLILTTAMLLLSSLVLWNIWTVDVAPAAIGFAYSPPLPLIGLALLLVVVLSTIALSIRWKGHGQSGKPAPRPLIVGVVGFTTGLLWFGLVAFAFEVLPALTPIVPLAMGSVLAVAVLTFVGRASSGSDWGDSHRVAVIFGGMGASMLAGFWASGITLPIDFVGKTLFDAAAVVLLARLASKVKTVSENYAKGP